jgi:hypothetical protein
MAAYQQNASCNPLTSRDSACLQGNYVEYALNVKEAADVAAGMKFAQAHNIRLVVKNTGHEYVRNSRCKLSLTHAKLPRKIDRQRCIEFVDAQSQRH